MTHNTPHTDALARFRSFLERAAEANAVALRRLGDEPVGNELRLENAIRKMAAELSGEYDLDLEMHYKPGLVGAGRDQWLASIHYKAYRAKNRWAYAYGLFPQDALIGLFQELAGKGAAPPAELRWLLPQ